jgi:glycosyltransferase involved in cell wall biosynthesis
MEKPLVSIVIPTKNSVKFLEACLESIKLQSYSRIEVILVDGQSKDGTVELAKRYGCTVYQFDPKTPKGTFDAPHRRNYGVKKAKGVYVYYVDADMVLTKNVVKESVILCDAVYDAAIVAEDSFGEGVWAKAKNLERRCYWGDGTVEAPRFFRKTVWDSLGGLDESLGGGGDDWDLYQKLKDNNHKVGRVRSFVMHNEGQLELKKLIKKRFMYGRDSAKYIAKRPAQGARSYFPLRKAYIRNWRLFVKRPVDSYHFVIMRTAEYGAGFAGIVYSTLKTKGKN